MTRKHRRFLLILYISITLFLLALAVQTSLDFSYFTIIFWPGAIIGGATVLRAYRQTPIVEESRKTS